jgi:hypothetical protein
MLLYLTKRSHLNSLYVNNNGQVLYKVETPFNLSGLVSTIKSALPGDIPAPGSSRISDTPSSYDAISDNNDDDVKLDGEPEDDVDEEPDDDVAEEPEDVGDEKDGPDEDIELLNRFAHLAEIKFNTIASSVIRYRGEEYETRKFFTRKFGWEGRYVPPL